MARARARRSRHRDPRHGRRWAHGVAVSRHERGRGRGSHRRRSVRAEAEHVARHDLETGDPRGKAAHRARGRRVEARDAEADSRRRRCSNRAGDPRRRDVVVHRSGGDAVGHGFAVPNPGGGRGQSLPPTRVRHGAAVPYTNLRMSEPVRIDDHAFANLRFIRETLERAGSFTSIPGWGGFAIGWTAVITSIIAARLVEMQWLEVWLTDAV